MSKVQKWLFPSGGPQVDVKLRLGIKVLNTKMGWVVSKVFVNENTFKKFPDRKNRKNSSPKMNTFLQVKYCLCTIMRKYFNLIFIGSFHQVYRRTRWCYLRHIEFERRFFPIFLGLRLPRFYEQRTFVRGRDWGAQLLPIIL